MDSKDFKELLTRRGRLQRGTRTIRIADDLDLRFDGQDIKGLVIDTVRFRKRNGDISPLQFEDSKISNLQCRRIDLDHFSFRNGGMHHSEIEQSNLFGVDITSVYIDNLRIVDCGFGMHLWETSHATGLKPLETAVDEFLPVGKRFFASPYVPHTEAGAVIQYCEGKDIEIIHAFGGSQSMTGLINNSFGNFSMKGTKEVPGCLNGWIMEKNLLVNSRFSDMVFFDSQIHNNRFVETPIERCIFENSSFLGSVIDLTPEILTSRFLSCRFYSTTNSSRDVRFMHGNKTVVGVRADLDGYLAVDEDREDEGLEFFQRSAVQRNISRTSGSGG